MLDEQIYDTAVEECIEAHVRITNLEMITQALADELMAQDDYIDALVAEYRHALGALDDYGADRWGLGECLDWTQTQEDARNAGNP